MGLVLMKQVIIELFVHLQSLLDYACILENSLHLHFNMPSPVFALFFIIRLQTKHFNRDLEAEYSHTSVFGR